MAYWAQKIILKISTFISNLDGVMKEDTSFFYCFSFSFLN